VNPINSETLKTIRESAEVARDASARIFGVVLAYDEASIYRIDVLITQGWPDGKSVASKTIQVWGCFLGEAICASLGATWVTTESGLGVMVARNVAHPITKMEKRFMNGMDDSISFFYETFKKISTASKSV